MVRVYKGEKTTHTKPEHVKEIFRSNIILIVVGIVIISVAVIAQTYRIQTIFKEHLTALAKAQYTDTTEITPKRGTIVSADGTILAIDQTVWNVYASLSKNEGERTLFFAHKDDYVKNTATALNIDPQKISALLTDNFQYVQIAKEVSTDQKNNLAALTTFGADHPSFGYYYEQTTKRVYPNGSLASQVLGFIGKDANGDLKGQYGIEGYYFKDLQGQPGLQSETKDSSGNIILTNSIDSIPQRAGKDITLTINTQVQYKVEQILKTHVEKQQAKSGSVIIMDPSTGAILAMANYPDYNPNEYWNVADQSVLKNKAVTDPYEYGSVQKPITAAIALESGKVTTDFTCHDTTGYVSVEGTKIYAWDRKVYGDLTMKRAIELSNNPCLVKVALATGFDYYFPKLTEFGVGEFVGIGLQDEETTNLMPYEDWTKLDLATSAFGQGISATPLQITSALSTIANKGKRMKPYIVSQIADAKETIKFVPTVLSQPISEDTANKVIDMMIGVVREGEARNLFNNLVPDYEIAGKTGTAQIPKKDTVGYYDDRSNVTFVGFAPAYNPKIIMFAKLEEPKTTIYSTYTVVPLWIDLFKAVAGDFQIPKK